MSSTHVRGRHWTRWVAGATAIGAAAGATAIVWAGLLIGGAGAAQADALCDQLRAQYGPGWPCVSVPPPQSVTPPSIADTPGAPQIGGSGPQAGAGGLNPGPGNGTPIVPVPGGGGGNGGGGGAQPPAEAEGPGQPDSATAPVQVTTVPPASNVTPVEQTPPMPPNNAPPSTTPDAVNQQHPERVERFSPADSSDGDGSDIPLAAWVVGGAAALTAAHPRAGQALRRVGGGVRHVAPASVLQRGGSASLVDGILPGGGSERGQLGTMRLVLINDALSPDTYVFDMDVPPGGRTVVNPDGSATVYDAEGIPVRRVKPPWAFDSLGQPQKTWYTVDENGNLVQHVDAAPNALYPILADPDDEWDPLMTSTAAQGPPSSPEQAQNMQAAQNAQVIDPGAESEPDPELSHLVTAGISDPDTPISGAENLPTAPEPGTGAGYPEAMNSMLVEGGQEPLATPEPVVENPGLADMLTTGIEGESTTENPERGPTQGAEPAPGQTLTYDDWIANNMLGAAVGQVNVRTGSDGGSEYYHTNPDGSEKIVTAVRATPNGELIYQFQDGSEIRADESARYRQAQEFIYNEMKSNRGSAYFHAMSDPAALAELTAGIPGLSTLSPFAKAELLSLFYLKVQAGGDWDHKPKLESMFGLEKPNDFYFSVPGTDQEVYYDIYSNIHYGYIGAEAGIPADVLIEAANLGTSGTGVNDTGDDIAVRAGAELSKERGTELTQADVNQTVTRVISDIEAAQNRGDETTQVRHK